MPYKFTTPTVKEGPAGGHRLFDFYTLDRGVTVIYYRGGFHEVRFPSQDLLNECEAYWLGGSEYVVDNDMAAKLTAAGYSENLTEIA